MISVVPRTQSSFVHSPIIARWLRLLITPVYVCVVTHYAPLKKHWRNSWLGAFVDPLWLHWIHFFQQKYWKEGIFSIPIQYSYISWFLQHRCNRQRQMNVFKCTKMCSQQYTGTDNRPRFNAFNVISPTDFLWDRIWIYVGVNSLDSDEIDTL